MIDFIQLMFALLVIALLFFISGIGISIGYISPSKKAIVPYNSEDFRDIIKVPSRQECNDLGYVDADYGKCVSAAVPRLPDIPTQDIRPSNYFDPMPYSE